MPRARIPLAGRSVLYVVLGVAVLSGHGLILTYAASHVALSAAVAAALSVLMLVKLALLGAPRRRWRSSSDR